MTEASKKFMTMSIWVDILLFVLRCSLSWSELSSSIDDKTFFDCVYSIFGYAGESIGFTAIFMACFNKWWWKWKPLNYISGGMPVLANKYKGKIHFKWDGRDQERDAEIEIEQTFFKVTVKLGNKESFSSSVTATIETINNEKLLVYTYLNMPRAEIQDRSAIHYGTAMLKVDNPKYLIGIYYTSRLSRGSMNFEAIDKGT